MLFVACDGAIVGMEGGGLRTARSFKKEYTIIVVIGVRQLNRSQYEFAQEKDVSIHRKHRNRGSI